MRKIVIHNHLGARDVISGAWEQAVSNTEASPTELVKASAKEQYRLREAIQEASREGNSSKVATLKSVLKHVLSRSNQAVQQAMMKEQAAQEPGRRIIHNVVHKDASRRRS